MVNSKQIQATAGTSQLNGGSTKLLLI